MLPESKTNPRFRVPNGFESRDEIVLRSLLPSATDDEKPAIEVFNLQIRRGRNVLRVIREESRPKFVALCPRYRRTSQMVEFVRDGKVKLPERIDG